ncbi:zinc-ribbon domain-containing protein, partial [Pelagibacteraceae bacterium]|nr:zinc-ribbon domain-containing protein [Pelagibacteraceae bacterium]
MLVNCNSCQKNFIVPDNAITKSGRLVQCGSCGNQWTQYLTDNAKSKKISPIKKKTTSAKPKVKKNLYTAEYLQKKHGLVINDNTKLQNIKEPNKEGKKTSFGFYSYVFFLLIFLITIFGLLNLSKEMIVLKYPASEI